LSGEAVYVDLGGGKNLFVLLGVDRWERRASRMPGRQEGIDGVEGGNDAMIESQLGEGSLNALWLPILVYKLGRTPGEERTMQQRANALLGQAPVEVSLDNLPMVATFADLKKPDTLRVMIPSDINNVLGEGYVLQSVKIQITEESQNVKIAEILTWINSSTNYLLVKCEKNKAELLAGKCWANKGYLQTIDLPPVNLN
jgi:hypothetical protein